MQYIAVTDDRSVLLFPMYVPVSQINSFILSGLPFIHQHPVVGVLVTKTMFPTFHAQCLERCQQRTWKQIYSGPQKPTETELKYTTFTKTLLGASPVLDMESAMLAMAILRTVCGVAVYGKQGELPVIDITSDLACVDARAAVMPLFPTLGRRAGPLGGTDLVQRAVLDARNSDIRVGVTLHRLRTQPPSETSFFDILLGEAKADDAEVTKGTVRRLLVALDTENAPLLDEIVGPVQRAGVVCVPVACLSSVPNSYRAWLMIDKRKQTFIMLNPASNKARSCENRLLEYLLFITERVPQWTVFATVQRGDVASSRVTPHCRDAFAAMLIHVYARISQTAVSHVALKQMQSQFLDYLDGASLKTKSSILHTWLSQYMHSPASEVDPLRKSFERLQMREHSSEVRPKTSRLPSVPENMAVLSYNDDIDNDIANNTNAVGRQIRNRMQGYYLYY